MLGLGRRCTTVALLLQLLAVTVNAVVSLDAGARMIAGRTAQYDELIARQAENPSSLPIETGGDKIFAYPYEKYTLDSNGLRVIIVPLGDDFPGIVSFRLVINAGSRDELEPGKTGMAHFFEHCMFRSTPNVSSDEFEDIYNEMGGRFNAGTSKDYTIYYVTFPKTAADGSSNLETVNYLESNRFKNINYTEAEFKTEAGSCRDPTQVLAPF